jgi:hypothetical protein
MLQKLTVLLLLLLLLLVQLHWWAQGPGLACRGDSSSSKSSNRQISRNQAL